MDEYKDLKVHTLGMCFAFLIVGVFIFIRFPKDNNKAFVESKGFSYADVQVYVKTHITRNKEYVISQDDLTAYQEWSIGKSDCLKEFPPKSDNDSSGNRNSMELPNGY